MKNEENKGTGRAFTVSVSEYMLYLELKIIFGSVLLNATVKTFNKGVRNCWQLSIAVFVVATQWIKINEKIKTKLKTFQLIFLPIIIDYQ